MKKYLAMLLLVAMTGTLILSGCNKTEEPATETTEEAADTTTDEAADTTSDAAGKTIYVTGPTPDHGWTAQAGTYAAAKVDEINAEGKYKAEYMPASTGEEQVDLTQTIIANGDAAGVVFFALEDSAAAGQEALIEQGIPFISFDRIIEGPDKSAILNFSGNNWQVGAGIAYWLQQQGMEPGDTFVTLIGDNGTVCSRRQEGFDQFLLGEVSYSDEALGQEFETTQKWTQEEIDALKADYKVVCDWSADKAYQYLEQNLKDIVAAAKANTGKLYVYSMDDEMTFGFLNLIEGNSIDDATKADLEALEVYVSAIGGMQELYDVMSGASSQSALADQYFDGLISMWFSPKMMTTAIDYMIQYLDGADWPYSVGDGEYEPTWIVGRDNVGEYEGFTGH
jgi:ribose transport system substrate-binding protein